MKRSACFSLAILSLKYLSHKPKFEKKQIPERRQILEKRKILEKKQILDKRQILLKK